MHTYDHKKIEKKWQERWKKKGAFQAKDFSRKPKHYILVEFPYPSGDGLHVGHVRSYTALDAVARKSRMEGKNVLYPMGWDAFGLPTENYALKTGIHPREATDQNISTFRRQLKSLGLSFDWEREIDTTDPKYVKWTQWIFLQLFKKDLAYQDEISINWCPSCKIGLANEEVVAGKCERCGTEVTQKMQKQWMLKITEYADRLLKDLDTVNYLDKIKTQQINWIGKSEGATIQFTIKNEQLTIDVFTTRPDTLFGATYMVLAPEHPLAETITTDGQREAVQKYVKETSKKSELERTELEKDKTGVFTGAYVVNPMNDKKIPIWIADYVMMGYGTGAIMAVPAHDERDYAFATKYKLPIKKVIKPPPLDGPSHKALSNTVAAEAYGLRETRVEAECYEGEGEMVNSGEFNGMDSAVGRTKIIAKLKKDGTGKASVQYKLRDWVFSRQHYWGEPIPIIHCLEHGAVAVQEKDLPVELPHVEQYEPSGTGESPLANVTEWVNTTCPTCDKPAKRETDTMPNWAGSSWYFLRYCDPKNDKAFADKKKLKYWMPVDLYNGGMEHTTLHLLYSRFWHKFLYDHKIVPTPEPYAHRHSHGMILAEDGKKMSKSYGNVINPDEFVDKYGADSLRLYELFIGPFEDTIPWSTSGLIGMHRFLDRVYKVCIAIADKKEELKDVQKSQMIHKTVKKVTEDIENFRFNTAISSTMEYIRGEKSGGSLEEFFNERDFAVKLNKHGELEGDEVDLGALRKFLTLLNPIAPHITEELWQQLKFPKTIADQKWPSYDESKIVEKEVELVIQVNGKIRAKVTVPAGISEEEAREKANAEPNVKKHITGEPKKVIFVPDRLINFVV